MSTASKAVPKPTLNSKFLTVTQVAEIAGCTRQAVDQAIGRQELAADSSFGKLRLVKRSDADRWVALHRARQGKGRGGKREK